MGRYAFGEMPDFVAHFDSSDWAGARRVQGVGEGWNLPVALFSVRGGFDNRAEPGRLRHHTLKWRVAGAPVFAAIGRGEIADPLRGAPVCVQSRASQARYWSDGDLDCAHIYLPDALIGDLAAELHDPGETRDLLLDDVAFAEDPLLAGFAHGYFRRAFAELAPSPLEMDARSLALAAHLVQRHSRLAGRPIRREPAKLSPRQLSAAMDLFCGGREVSLRLADVGRQVGLSPFHFCRAFHNSVGLPPHRWLLEFRLERAAQLLRTTRLSVLDIAAAVGYDDPSYFARLFRKYRGLSPTLFRHRLDG